MTRKRFVLSIAKITIVPVLAISVAGGVQIAGQSLKPQSSVESSSVFKEVSPQLQSALKLGADGNYDAAIPTVETALSTLEKALGPEHPDVATALDILARLYGAKGDSVRAVSLYQRSLAIREKVLGPEHRDVAIALGKLAALYKSRGDYVRAEPLYQRSLAILEKVLGPDHRDVAVSLDNLGTLYHDKGDYVRAEQLQQRSLAILEKTLGPEHLDVAIALNNLAPLYGAKRAEALYQRSLAIVEKALGPDSTGVAITLDNLAELYRSEGDYVRAEPMYQRSLAILEKALGPDDPNLATVLNNLALLYKSKGDYTHAEPLYMRSLKISVKVLGPEHPAVAASLSNLAGVRASMGNYVSAEEFYKLSLAILEKALGPNHSAVADALNNLGTLYRSKGDYVRAEQFLQRSLAIREKFQGPDSRDVAESLHSLALLYESKGDYVRAEPLHQRSLAIREKVLGPYHPDVAISLNSLAAYESRSDLQKVFPLRTRAMIIEEHNLALILATGSEEQKRAYLAALSGSTDFNICLHALSAPSDRQALDLALTTVLQRKGRVLEAMAESNAALRRRLNPQDRELLNQLNDVRSRLATLALSGPRKTDLAGYRAETQKLDEEAQHLESAVSARSAEFRVLSQPVTIERVQALIPEGAALVELVSYKTFDLKTHVWQATPSYAVYVLRHEGSPAGINLGEAAPIDTAVSALRVALRDPKSADLKQRARDLDEKVMRPIRKLLGETRTVLLSPDGALNLVPFSALVDEQDRYLAESYSFTYLTSGRDLLRLQLRSPARQGPIIIADPQFDLRTSVSSAGVQAEGRRSVDFTSLEYPPLPGTALEAKEVNAILHGAKVLTGAQATEAALKQVQGPAILHIATHGFFLQDQPQQLPERRLFVMNASPGSRSAQAENPLLRSGLVFAGVKNGLSGTGEDGVLTALETSSLDLVGTKLVVLSACDTGVGDVTNGEGVYGLRRALVLAGAESQVMSLWPVSDEGTRELMSDYYHRLVAGEGRTEAMRRAQLKMLSSPARRHPYYWAAFIQSGDWTGL